MLSLPFRLYWQLSDPTAWMTIISQSPCCVPPVSQTYSQKSQLVDRKPDNKSFQKLKPTSTSSNYSHNVIFTHLCNFVTFNLISHLHHFVPNLTERLEGATIKYTLREVKPFHERKEITLLKVIWGVWNLRGRLLLPPLKKCVSPASVHFFGFWPMEHFNISMWLHYVVADYEWLASFKWSTHPSP